MFKFWFIFTYLSVWDLGCGVGNTVCNFLMHFYLFIYLKKFFLGFSNFKIESVSSNKFKTWFIRWYMTFLDMKIYQLISFFNFSDANVFVYCCDFSAHAINIVTSDSKYDPEKCLAFQFDLTSKTWSLPFSESSLDIVTMIFVLSGRFNFSKQKVLIDYLCAAKGLKFLPTTLLFKVVKNKGLKICFKMKAFSKIYQSVAFKS